jgi:hemin uptake protein HemP
MLDSLSRIIIIPYMVSEPRETKRTGMQAGAVANEQRRRVSSAALLGNLRELVIEHNGREYRLRVTSQGNLILTA